MDEGEEGDEHEGEGDRGSRTRRGHERRVAARGAVERQARLHERHQERQHEGEMAQLRDHGFFSSSCQRPAFLSAWTTSGGI